MDLQLLNEIKNMSEDKVKLLLMLQAQQSSNTPPPPSSPVVLKEIVEAPPAPKKPKKVVKKTLALAEIVDVPEEDTESIASISSNSSLVGKGKVGMKKPVEELSNHPVAVLRRNQYEANKNNPEYMKKKSETARRYREKAKAKKLAEKEGGVAV